MDIITVGINHKTGGVEVREKLAFSAEQITDLLPGLAEQESIEEALIISTCNRMEIYAVVDELNTAVVQIKDFLGKSRNINKSEFEDKLYVYHQPHSVSHLFEVASGLDSMVLGEKEILGQVKQAYALAEKTGSTSRILNRLLQTGFNIAKKVRRFTGIDQGSVSVGSVAVGLAQKIFGELKGKSVMIIGAGQMSEATARYLVDRGRVNIVVAGRTYEKAQALAGKFNGRAIAFEEHLKFLAEVDIVISATSAPRFLIRKEDIPAVMKKRRQRPVFFIDIAVPRNIDPEVNSLDNVYLYNIDDLKSVVVENISARQAQVVKGEKIIAQGTAEFMCWFNCLDLNPTITGLKEEFERIRHKELQESLSKIKNITDQQRQQMEGLSLRLMKQYFHTPATRLKECARQKGGYLYVEALRELFGLKKNGNEK